MFKLGLFLFYIAYTNMYNGFVMKQTRFREVGGFESGNDNQRENKQFRDLTRHLSKGQRRRIHDVISGRGWSYQRLKEYIQTI